MEVDLISDDSNRANKLVAIDKLFLYPFAVGYFSCTHLPDKQLPLIIRGDCNRAGINIPIS